MSQNQRLLSHRLLRLALLALVLLGGVAHGWSASARTSKSTPTADDFVTDGTSVDGMEVYTPTPSSPETSGLQTEAERRASDPIVSSIDDLLTGEEGIYGIVLIGEDGSVEFSQNSSLPFVSASLYKLVLMADVCAAVDRGDLTLDTPLYVDPSFYDSEDGTDAYFDPSYAGSETTIDEALFATGAYSSNVAAKTLLGVTNTEDLNAMAVSLGLDHTHLFLDPKKNSDWPPQPADDSSAAAADEAETFVLGYATDGQVNVTTPADMARFFSLLLEGKVVNQHVSSMIMDILKQQQINDRFPSLLPEETKLAHKTGNLEHVVHDAGVIWAPDGPVILIAMAQAQNDDERATQIEQRLALIAYGDYDVPPMSPATPTASTPVARDEHGG